MTSRTGGVLVPLFSLRSTRSWGIGEFADLPVFARWLGNAGQSLVQILPITEVPAADTSPYSALTAMALDPVFVTLNDVEDFAAIGGEAALQDREAQALAALRSSTRVPYGAVRRLKEHCLRRAHARFVSTERAGRSARAQRFAAYQTAEAYWLDDYALFQALRTRHRLLPWWQWPPMDAARSQSRLDAARREHADEIDFRGYVQWVAHEQWSEARRQSAPIRIFGDLPFMISADSPDVWARQDQFRFDATIGVPPDAFSDTGQDWGLPPWRWEVMAARDFDWMRLRARRMAALFDGFRLDHLVGLYRTYVRPLNKSVPGFFSPPDEPTERRLGERLVALYRDSGAEIIAEDLGTIPDFVRESLTTLGVPGLKVMRWERRWRDPAAPFIDPQDYDAVSVATTGTHDTEPLAVWWDAAADSDRRLMLAVPSVQRHLLAGMSPIDAMVRALLDAGSSIAILPLQDVFGWTDRINTPAVVDDQNWTWALPWPVDTLEREPLAVERAEWLAAALRVALRRDAP